MDMYLNRKEWMEPFRAGHGVFGGTQNEASV